MDKFSSKIQFVELKRKHKLHFHKNINVTIESIIFFLLT